ncbi:radical SAM protein [Faecalicatena contorta]|uniref:radical SAM protein n=1 Tax=Faecalicatena contorta TaxID=39482 RepID=UPI001F1DD39B|nr:radical SAM protein [Faecalicatena contorta]MCF2681535.1 radical SAM protein [Faecalicatena contorta]
MKDNLFSAVYEVEKILFGDSDKGSMRREVRQCILEHRVPEGPKYLMMKITNRCNSNCAYCSHAYSNQEEEKSDISLDLIKKTIREAGDMHVTAASINGGEPLVRQDIDEIIRALIAEHITPVLMTNGLLLPKRWDELGAAGLRYIIMSFDSLDPETYNKQRGADFQDAMAGIDAAVALKEKYGDAHIHVTTVLTKNNAKELPGFIEYMTSRGIYVQISPYHHFNPSVPNELRITDPEEIFTLTGTLLKMKREGMLIANSEGFIAHLPDFFLKDQRVPSDYRCLIGYTNVFVDAYMNVHCCWDGCFKPIGNLQERSLKEIWNSEEYQEAREQMMNCDCSGCWYLCTGEVTMFLLDQEM